MALVLSRKISELENLAFAFLAARRAEKISQQSTKKMIQQFHEQHRYFSKEKNQLIYLTKRQHQCLWAYHQCKNIKSVALNMSLAKRTAEEHLKLVRKKFQMQKLKLLVDALDQRLIECVDKGNARAILL